MARQTDHRSPDPERPRQQAAARAHLAPSVALDIQRTAGNRALIQLLRQAGHPWAQEQHQHSAGCGHQAVERPAVQRSAVHDVVRTSGRPLDDATRTDMESRLGADFSDVRVHDDSAAKASAAEVGARAYTSGNHVVIGAGGDDRHTLAHELTHVIQQRQGPVAGTDNGAGLKVSDPSDRYEREAEANADRVMSGPAPTVVARAPADDRGRRTGSGEVGVQRVIGQNNSTAGVDHAQGEHVFNDVSTLATEFKAACRTNGGALARRLHPVQGDGMNQDDTTVAFMRLRVQAAATAANQLTPDLIATLNTRRRHALYGTVPSGNGDDDNAELFGRYKQDILTLANSCHPDNIFQENLGLRSVPELRTALANTIVDRAALTYLRTRHGASVVDAWFTPAMQDMNTAFGHIFTALDNLLQIKNRLINGE
ncbi:eCIS core domain-containing protein [Streptomyces sp. CB02261]|uniref:eCIS core domain-containing protein n=1 Tax=Streptomyces sp. CB02261 TaxID=1703940 RepID=UPI0009A0EC62|nr:DUF4157 domain-containing protein [Streptomyces sp. CB02261]